MTKRGWSSAFGGLLVVLLTQGASAHVGLFFEGEEPGLPAAIDAAFTGAGFPPGSHYEYPAPGPTGTSAGPRFSRSFNYFLDGSGCPATVPPPITPWHLMIVRITKWVYPHWVLQNPRTVYYVSITIIAMPSREVVNIKHSDGWFSTSGASGNVAAAAAAVADVTGKVGFGGMGAPCLKLTP